MPRQITGVAVLPLHYGRCPRWLFKKMTQLALEIGKVIILEYGPDEFLRRLADPFWFQAFGCVLAFDWHSSGVTTTVMGALKEALRKEEVGIGVAGGKGKVSRQTPQEIEKIGDQLGLGSKKIEKLKYSSRLAAKVDNTALQDSYQIYHHTFTLTEKGKWVVIQQGMNPADQTARRYHWMSENVKSFVQEPESAICCDVRHRKALNLIAKESKECRKTVTDLVKEQPAKIQRELVSIRPKYQKGLNDFFKKYPAEKKTMVPALVMPRRLNWAAFERAYQLQPKNFEGVLAVPGLGPKSIRALALVAELVYGDRPSWKDPVKFAFAHGGKDWVPYKPSPRVMQKSIDMLREGIEEARLGKKEKLRALERMRFFLKGAENENG